MVDSIGGSQFEYDADFDVSGIESAVDKVINKFKLAKKEANELKSILDKMTEKAGMKIQKTGTAQSLSTNSINKFETKYSLNTDEFDKAITKITNTINKRLEKYASDLAKAKAEAIANLKAEQQAEEQAEATTTSAEKKKQTFKKNTNKKIKENTKALKEEAQVAEETATRIEQAEAKKQKAYNKTVNAKKNAKSKADSENDWMILDNGKALDYKEFSNTFAHKLTMGQGYLSRDEISKFFNWQKSDGEIYKEKDFYNFLMKGNNPNSRYYNRTKLLANTLFGNGISEKTRRDALWEYNKENGLPADSVESAQWLQKFNNNTSYIARNALGAKNIFDIDDWEKRYIKSNELYSVNAKKAFETQAKALVYDKPIIWDDNSTNGNSTEKVANKNKAIETTTKKIKKSVEAEEQLQKKVEKTAEVVEKAEAKQQQAIKKTVKTKQEAISFSPVENKTVEKNLASGNYFTLSNGKVIDYDKFVDEFAKTVSNDKIVSNKIQADGIKNFIGWKQGKNEKNGNFTDAEAVKKFFYDQDLGIDDNIKNLLINGVFDTANKSLYNKAFDGYSSDIDIEDFEQFRDIASKAIEMVQFALGDVKVGTGNSKSYLSWNKYQDALNGDEDITALLDKMDAKRDKLLNGLYIDSSSNSKKSSMLNNLYANIPNNNTKKETVEKVKNEEIKAVEDLGTKVEKEVKKVEKVITQSSNKIQEQVKPTTLKSDMTLEEQTKVRAEMASMQKENQAYLEKMANKNNTTTPVVKKNKNLVKAVQVPSEYDPFASIIKGKMSWEDRRSLRGYYNWGKSQFNNDDALLYSRATGKLVLTTDAVDIKDLVQDKSFYGGMDWNTRRSLRGYYNWGKSQFYNTGYTLVGNPYDNNPYTREQQNLMQPPLWQQKIRQMTGEEISQVYIDKVRNAPLMIEDKNLIKNNNKEAVEADSIFVKVGKDFEHSGAMLSSMASEVGLAFRNLGNNIRTWSSVMYSTIHLVQALQNVMNISDSINSIGSRFERYDTTGASKDTLLKQLFNYSNDARSDIDSFGTLAQRILATDVTKGNGEEAMKLASLISKSMVLGGSTGQEISSAQLQLSQGLAANQLGGDELKALRENAVGFTEMLAKGLNKGYEQGIFTNSAFKGAKIGNLKDIGAKGLLTAEVVTKALTLMSDEINSEFGKMPQLFSQTVNKLMNTFKEKLNKFNEEGRGLTRIAKFFEKIDNFLNTEKGQKVLDTLMTSLDAFIAFLEKIGTFISDTINSPVGGALLAGLNGYLKIKPFLMGAELFFGTKNTSGLFGAGGIGSIYSNFSRRYQTTGNIFTSILTSPFRQGTNGLSGGLIPTLILSGLNLFTNIGKTVDVQTRFLQYIDNLSHDYLGTTNYNNILETLKNTFGLSEESNLVKLIQERVSSGDSNYNVSNLLLAKVLAEHFDEVKATDETPGLIRIGESILGKATGEASGKLLGNKLGSKATEEATKTIIDGATGKVISTVAVEGATSGATSALVANGAGATGVLGKISAGLTGLLGPVGAIAAVIGVIAAALGFAWHSADKKAEEQDWTDFKDKYLNFDGHKYLTDDAKNRIINNARAQYDSKYNKWGKLIGGTLSEKDELDMKTSIMKEVVDAERTEYLKQISENTAKAADNTAGSFEITEEFLRNMNDIQTRQFKAQLGMSGNNGGVQNTWSVIINNQSDLNNLVEQLSTAVVQSQEASLV